MVVYGRPMVEDTTKAAHDPRPDLRKRIRTIETELAEMDERRPRLVKLLATYKALLTQEDAVHENQTDSDVDEKMVPAFHPTRDNRTLADLILRVLGTGPKTLDELKDIGAETWAPIKDSTFPGRAINFALVGLQKGGYVERLKNGVWKIVPAKFGE
jgi:hypothetical protein